MSTEYMIKSLPLVAAVLGQKYGVQVRIGGTEACTNGKIIHLPSLPSKDSDKTMIASLRGYLDHEAAHVRETDFTALTKAQLSPLEGFITNVIEDWRVEKKLGEIFQGCKSNFTWLIKHIFGTEEYRRNILTEDLDDLVPNYILISVRAWEVAELEPLVEEIEDRLLIYNSLLLTEINIMLQDIRASCSSTKDSIDYAKKIVEIIEGYAVKVERQDQLYEDEARNKDSPDTQSRPEESEENQSNNQFDCTHQEETDSQNKPSAIPAQSHDHHDRSLSKLINKSQFELPTNIGEVLANNLETAAEHSALYDKPIDVATIGTMRLSAFPEEAMKEIKRIEAALRTRLKSCVQSMQMERGTIGRRGKIKTDRLAHASVGEAKVFSRFSQKKGVDTAVHILLDCSGSMHKRISLTTSSCLALASSLSSIKGVNVGVTAFPAISCKAHEDSISVAPIVEHGQQVHGRFDTDASGSTPMGEALWWVLQQMVTLQEVRKIVLIITDGRPDQKSVVDQALNAGSGAGIEFYGIGIRCTSIESLSLKKSCVVNNLSDLAQSMFELLKDAIIRK